MKVVLLAPTPPPAGGIAGWTVRMMNAELKNGWEVAVVDEKTGRESAYASTTSIRAELSRCKRIWRDLTAALKDKDVKVVHSCIPSRTTSMLREYICACITKAHHRKFIIHFRCTVPNTVQGKLGRFMLKRLCNKSDLIMTLNEQTNNYIKKLTKTPYVLIPNFISESELLTDRGINDEIDTVLYVGGVIENKGAFEFLSVAEQFPNIQFRCLGKVDEKVSKYIEQHPIPNVCFAGTKNRDEVKDELSKADVFAFLTYFEGEGFSNALCEAMAAGLPCLVTDWAANKDMIEDKGGYVVPIKDADAAAKALKKMMPYQVRKDQSDFNISKVKSSYIEKTVIDRYVDAYESLLR